MAESEQPTFTRGVLRPTKLVAGLFALIALITVAIPVPVAVPILLSAVVAGCVLADWLSARRLRPSLVRTRPPTLALRVPVAFSARIDNVGGARSLRSRQPSPPALQLRPEAAAGNAVTGTLSGLHRGRHELPPAVVRASGPLALSSVDYRVGGTTDVVVYPDLPGARRMAAARRRGRTTDEGRIRARLGLGTEFETIRDYSPDDDIRQVNWVATARVSRPMSNQYRVEENRDVMLVVDAGRLMASPVGELTRLDVALDAVAVLAVAAEEAGDRVGTLAFDEKVSRQLAPRRRGADAIVRALFDLEPHSVESDYERAFIAVGRQKRALVVLFTDIVDEAATRTLISACPVLLRHHAVLVASCADPDLAAAVAAAPNDVRDVMRTTVALDLLSSRTRAVRLLEAMGADVVEASPETLGPACVRAYVRLKQRARL